MLVNGEPAVFVRLKAYNVFLFSNELVVKNLCGMCECAGVYKHNKPTRKYSCNSGRRSMKKSDQAKFCGMDCKPWHLKWHYYNACIL